MATGSVILRAVAVEICLPLNMNILGNSTCKIGTHHLEPQEKKEVRQKRKSANKAYAILHPNIRATWVAGVAKATRAAQNQPNLPQQVPQEV